MMQTIPLGKSSLNSTRLAYGCWRLAGDLARLSPESEKHGRDAVIAAYEAGYTLFDNADIYGRGHAERIFGDALHGVPGMREKILIATKCGIRFANDPPGSPQRWDFSAKYIIQSCEESLKRMRIEVIDLFQLHRPDYLADPAEIAGAFSELQRAGKVRFFGVSNFRPSLVSALQAACPMPLTVNQVEISLARTDCFTDGTLDQCLENKMTPLAWSPLARGLLGDGVGATPEQKAAADRIVPVLDAIAQSRGVSRTVVALAWLLKHPSQIIPIVGSTNPSRIREAVAAANLELTRDEWYRLLVAALGEPLP
jgi:predicted oxidoreductase